MRRLFALAAAGALMIVMAGAPAGAKQAGIPPHDDPFTLVEGTTVVCHVPPNDQAGDPFLLRVPGDENSKAVKAHLRHGDVLFVGEACDFPVE